MTDPDALVAAELARLGISPGGVPQVEESPILGGSAAPFSGPLVTLTAGSRPPIYRQGAAEEILMGMALEVRVRLQERMVGLGLASNVILGEIDDSTVKGLETLMTLANRRGERWGDTLTRLTSQQAAMGGGLPTEAENADVYLAPDYASLAEQVKATFKQRLRRDPTDAEMALLGDELSALYRKQFDVQQGAAQQAEGAGAGRVIEAMDVDPVARFNQEFEKRYAGELDVVENVDTRQRANETSSMVLDSFGSLIGGMGR